MKIMSQKIKLQTKNAIPFTVDYEIIRSRRKTCSLSLDQNGFLTVRVPLFVHNAEVIRLLTEKQFWIASKLAEQKQRQEARPDLPVPAYTEAERAAIEKRCRAAAADTISKRAAYYTAAFPDIIRGSYSRISIRDQKTRWGRCSSRGTLSFNWRLMLAPPDILDYVIVHELCHLTHMNHSPAFWQCVEHILPDYKTRRKWLKENGYQLTLV